MAGKYVKVQLEEKFCKVCGTLFKPRMKTSVYCGKSCARDGQNQKASDWYYSHRDGQLKERKAYMEEWRKRNPGQTYMKCITSLFHGAKDRAAKSNLEFSITTLDISVPEICPILGVEMKRPGRYAPSLDRIDTHKGYTPDNIWVISKLANRMKNDSTPDELRRFAEWAAKQSTL